MNFFDFSFWQNFVSNLLATIIGVALGIPVAFWINRRVGDITEKKKERKYYKYCGGSF
jgi:ABC-type spermidine/putrescine transport system permease subunit I